MSRHFVVKSVWDNGARTSLKLCAGMVSVVRICWGL